MRRRGSASIAANPVLIGAATTLVVLVAVFLSYNANNGLPFVPTYDLKADVPSAAQLVKGNEVRIGGTRVGVVTGIRPKRLANGRVIAQLDLKLETTVKPLPKDSTFFVRAKNALGLKYVEIAKGTSAEGYENGATLPLSASRPEPVEFDEFLSTFDDPTRRAAQKQIEGFGDALAGRGRDLNAAIQAFGPLLEQLTPAMANLADDRTQLARFSEALGRTSAIVAPVAETQAALFRNLDTTFDAFAAVARPYLQDSISGGPPALDTAIEELPKQRPFLANNTRFFAALRPGAAALASAAPDLADALTVGTPALRQSVQLNRRLEPTFRSLEAFAEDPLVKLGIDDLTATVKIANPLFANITPAQTVCNYWSILLRNAAEMLSEGDANGTAMRFMITAGAEGVNSEIAPSAAPANGGPVTYPTTLGPGFNYLHSNPYPNTAAPGQTRECEAGNEEYLRGRQVIGNVPGNQGTATEVTKRSDDTPQP
jgi:virulence factor Mce-like protein